MISHISIKDFAIIENAEIDFHHGLNIITGETGAGKSIVIEAVSLALGARADTAFVRSGKDKAIVQLAGEIDQEEIVITREVSAAGKNLCRLNGELITLGQLNTYCKRLADIHGQYDHQSLLNPEYHIKLVDLYHHHKITPLKEETSVLYSKYTDLSNKLQALLKDNSDAERKRDFMKFELNDIQNSKLTVGEDEQLKERVSLLQNSEKIYQNLSAAYETAFGSSPSAASGVEFVMRLLGEISSYSHSLSSIYDDLSDIYYRLEDKCHEIRCERDKVIFSPEELDEALSRLDEIENLKRKYGGSIESVLAYGSDIENQLSNYENIDEYKAKLKAQIAVAEKELDIACKKLTQCRKIAAKELEVKITDELHQLNFNNSQLSIDIHTSPSKYTSSGTDTVEFLISTNAGEPLKPLSKIASGGEMSRIMLAFKNIIADYDEIPTMIFDEIDAGISGISASIVGKKLKEIAQKHQIICITHLPQIAAFGEYNYKITKETVDSKTRTIVLPLTDEEKIGEISRLLGGINITENTIKSAGELIALSK